MLNIFSVWAGPFTQLIKRPRHLNSLAHLLIYSEEMTEKVPMKTMFFLFTLLFLTATRASSLDSFKEQLAKPEWAVGCYVGQANDQKEKCQELNIAMKRARILLLEDPGQFQKLLKESLARIKDPKSYNYFPLLLAVVTSPELFRAEIEAISKIERKAGLNNQYATQALARFTTMGCKKPVAARYREICFYHDQLISRYGLPSKDKSP